MICSNCKSEVVRVTWTNGKESCRECEAKEGGRVIIKGCEGFAGTRPSANEMARREKFVSGQVR